MLGLWQDRKRPSRQVRALALAHIEELDEKLEELQSMKSTLEHLVHCCHGDDRPDCPIIDSLAQERREEPKQKVRRSAATVAEAPEGDTPKATMRPPSKHVARQGFGAVRRRRLILTQERPRFMPSQPELTFSFNAGADIVAVDAHGD